MSLLITLLILCAIAGIVWYVLNSINLPPPFRIVFIVIFAIIAIYMLLQLMPGGSGLSLPA